MEYSTGSWASEPGSNSVWVETFYFTIALVTLNQGGSSLDLSSQCDMRVKAESLLMTQSGNVKSMANSCTTPDSCSFVLIREERLQTSSCLQILFIGYVGASALSDIALDSIDIEDCGCPQTVPPSKYYQVSMQSTTCKQGTTLRLAGMYRKV